MTDKKKLIEVALPLEAINRESAREKSIRHGHPSTLHLWWARRPLAACRAVLFSSLVDDPSSRPDRFPTEDQQAKERQRLFDLIEDLVKWENTTSERVFNAARAEIQDAFDGHPPPVYDPFAGGGSIPLEAQRLGLESHASDLNPVAVLINKALIELPSRFSGRTAIHEDDQHLNYQGPVRGARGLAADVLYYGEWLRERAAEELGVNYPRVQLPGGTSASVIAWLWCRTVQCPNPACCGTAPLMNSFNVVTKKGKEVWLRPEVDDEAKTVRFEIVTGPGSPKGGTIARAGGECLICHEKFQMDYVREQGALGRLGLQLVATVAEGSRRRHYLPPSEDQLRAAQVERPKDVPSIELSTHPQYMGVTNYGLTRSSDLFTDRQLLSMVVFTRLVGAARELCLQESGDSDYADAIAVYLALACGRLANRLSTQCFWDPPGEKVNQVFARNALPMVWVFAEANPLSQSSGNFSGQLNYLVNALRLTPARGQGHVEQLDALRAELPKGACISTDPPYYDNVPYADLSDFFYPWLRDVLKSTYPLLFSTLGVPKSDELVADSTRHGGKEAARVFFEDGLRTFFTHVCEAQTPDVPFTVFYAFRQSETDSALGTASTGWETMLQGLVDSGFAVTATWPIRTEQTGGLREFGRNALASSIVLACRVRPSDAGITDRRSFVAALRAELSDRLRQLQQGNVAPVDLAQASIGPGMAVFSRYARVVEADGSNMTVRTALGLINQVLDQTLAEQEADFDAETRWAVSWFEQSGMNPGAFGVAETLSKAKNTAINALVQAGIVESKGGRVRLLDRSELPLAWDPATDQRLTVWEITHHMIRILEDQGETGAADLLRRIGGLGEAARELAYRLYVICERKKWAKEALAYNSLVTSWSEISRLASTATAPESAQQELL